MSRMEKYKVVKSQVDIDVDVDEKDKWFEKGLYYSKDTSWAWEERNSALKGRGTGST